MSKNNDQAKHFDIEGEVIFGAIAREQQWKLIAAVLAGVALLGVGTAAAVTVLHAPPPPVLVPYNPETGVAMPNAALKAVTLTEEDAVVEASVYRYVVDRETFNQIDNDVRIPRALDLSEGRAFKSLQALWDSSSEYYPPSRYGDNAEITVDVRSITRITNDRAQVRFIKRLVTPDGNNSGAFTAVLKYRFDPTTETTLEAVWQNPFGFTVSEYSVTADKNTRN